MPDHLHAIIAFPREPGMATTVKNWKKFVAEKYGVDWHAIFLITACATIMPRASFQRGHAFHTISGVLSNLLLDECAQVFLPVYGNSGTKFQKNEMARSGMTRLTKIRNRYNAVCLR